MSFFDDAQTFMKNRPAATAPESEKIDLTNAEEVERVVKRLKSLYDNATESEIAKTLDLAQEKLGPMPTSSAFYLFARQRLED